MKKSRVSINNYFSNEKKTFSKATDHDEQQIINREIPQTNGVMIKFYSSILFIEIYFKF
jgi:hypothetical protein